MTADLPPIPDPSQPITSEEKKSYNPDSQYRHPFPPPGRKESTSTLIVVLNLPKTPKKDKLTEFLRKVIAKKCGVKDLLLIHMPFDGKQTTGIAFVEAQNDKDATNIVKNLNNYPFDKSHTLEVRPYKDVEKYRTVNEEKYQFKEPEFVKLPQLWNWLKNPLHDQFLIQVKERVSVFWNDVLREGEPVVGREKWTDGHVGWSDQGSFLITWHKLGYALWGGDKFEPLAKLKHNDAVLIEFSPKETHAVTVNAAAEDNTIIWDTRSSKPVIKFSIPRETVPSFPLFRWSADEKYFARQEKGTDFIKIYSTDSYRAIHPIRIPNLKDFSFCPKVIQKSVIIAYCALNPENSNATIGLYSLPKGQPIGQTINIVGVKDLQIDWNPSGEFVAVKVERETRVQVGIQITKKDIVDFQVFRLMDKGVPVDRIEVTDELVKFGWEPYGKCFSIICKEMQKESEIAAYNNKVVVYSFDEDKVKEVNRINNTPNNEILWSPRGQHAVLTDTRTANRKLEFWDLRKGEKFGEGEQFKMTNASWDPTGRYLCSLVDAYNSPDADHGFIIWNVLGRMMYRKRFDGLWTFRWRNRPESLVTEKLKKKVLKQLPHKVKKYKQEEAQRTKKEKDEQVAHLRQKWENYLQWRRQLTEEHRQEKQDRLDLGYDSDPELVEAGVKTVEKITDIEK